MIKRGLVLQQPQASERSAACSFRGNDGFANASIGGAALALDETERGKFADLTADGRVIQPYTFSQINDADRPQPFDGDKRRNSARSNDMPASRTSSSNRLGDYPVEAKEGSVEIEELMAAFP